MDSMKYMELQWQSSWQKTFCVTSVKILARVSVLSKIFGGGFSVGAQISLPPSDFLKSHESLVWEKISENNFSVLTLGKEFILECKYLDSCVIWLERP